MQVGLSVSENEIVCYNIGHAITNAKVRGPCSPLKRKNPPALPGSDAYVVINGRSQSSARCI